MLGPWLPIYGAGGVLAVLLLRRFADKPLRVFALGVALCTVIEYVTGRYLDSLYGLRWWDYSMLPLNIDGLVSPLTSLVFGAGCCAAVYWRVPWPRDGCGGCLSRRRGSAARCWRWCSCWTLDGLRCIPIPARASPPACRPPERRKG